MPSNDVRTLLHTAVPTVAAGVVAIAVATGVAGGKGALGAVVGTLVVILFMGVGLVVLQRVAKAYPHLFQGMGLLLYTTQLLLLFVFMATFKDTTLFDSKVFALTLLATTIVWVAAQARAYMKAKILYVDPEAAKSDKPEKTGSST
ncbi:MULTISPECIES: hypothetical protein [Streptomyces]|uniref:ATP synthase I n=2 Tax=Streptomyces TaxID=1883 RepID=A0A646K9Q9_STRJU|nr:MULTISPECIES: hypothetical protein [Streptomyces]MQS37476.1 hypothetical protein [Streptomyces katsurahamanus]MQS98883.1 hypothetical protein [Streptomyces jumonjinensis]